MREWFALRVNLYSVRKDHMLAKLKKEYETIRNKVMFIKGVIDETIHIKKVKRSAIVT